MHGLSENVNVANTHKKTKFLSTLNLENPHPISFRLLRAIFEILKVITPVRHGYREDQGLSFFLNSLTTVIRTQQNRKMQAFRFY